MSGWFGFWAPKGTPKEAIDKLNGAMRQVLADPAIKARFSRARARCRGARAADAGGPGGIPEGRDREVVADHQGGGREGGVSGVCQALKPGGADALLFDLGNVAHIRD